MLLIEDRGAPWDLVAAAGGTDGRGRTYDSFVTEEGLLGLAGIVDGVSVGKSRLIGGPRSSTDVASAARRAANGGPLRGSELVDAAHAAGLAVYTWTLRPENRFLAQPNRRGTTRAFFWALEEKDRPHAWRILKEGLEISGPLWLMDTIRLGLTGKYKL